MSVLIGPEAGAGLASSLLLVGLLGFRHGFDADHIAAVDGMTRARQLQHSYWTARGVGLQFALGHSGVILFASLLLYGQSAALPAWLDGFGKMVSFVFLLFIAATNFAHAWRPSQAAPAGPLARALLRATGGNLHPVLVGMAFAMSFDAWAQAAFFATRGAEFSGFAAVGMLAAAFGIGMVVADAGNGALIAWCARRGDRMARQASRWASAFIALLALATALSGIARELSPGFAQAWDHAGIWLGVGLVGIASFGLLGLMSWQRARTR
ncbi:MAG: hypothetical protein ABIO45_00415 [Burkholderiaceae bacterium]